MSQQFLFKSKDSILFQVAATIRAFSAESWYNLKPAQAEELIKRIKEEV